MRRILITNLQWWLLVALLSLTFAFFPRVDRLDWWWSPLFITGFYVALFAILRPTWETRRQAEQRRSARRLRRRLKRYGLAPWQYTLLEEIERRHR